MALTEEQRAQIARNKAAGQRLAAQRIQRDQAERERQRLEAERERQRAAAAAQTTAGITPEQRVNKERNYQEGLKRQAARRARDAAAAAAASTSTALPSYFPPPSTSMQVEQQQQQQQQQQQGNDAGNAAASSTPAESPINAHLNRPPSDLLRPTSRLSRPDMNISYRCRSFDRIEINFRPFDSAVVDVLKKLKSSRYDENGRFWSVSVDEFRDTHAILKTIKPYFLDFHTVVDHESEDIYRMLSCVRQQELPSDLATLIGKKMFDSLFPYQKAGIKFALERNGRVIIGDEMGLGKSIQALAVMRYYKRHWPLLIICPSSVKSVWKNVETFLPDIANKEIHIIHKTSDRMPDVETRDTVIIMSYEQMKLRMDELGGQLKYTAIIVDECHMLKDSKSQRTIDATLLAKKAVRVILLSGTPALSRPAELFSQIKMVNDMVFPKYHNFAIRYCDGRIGRFGFEAKGCTNSEELSAILFKRIMIRRLKSEVLSELPDKIREVVFLSGQGIDTRMESLQAAKAAFNSSNNEAAKHDSLLTYYNETGIVKAAAICEHILEKFFPEDVEKAARRKVLIFAHHRTVLDAIQNEVKKRGIGHIRIDGTTPAKDRGELCEKFQEQDEVEAAILSITAAGVGITLTAASAVVFAELSWNPGSLLQAEDRAHRVGQKDSVYVQYLVARNTADDVLWPMVQGKLDVLAQINLANDSFREASTSHVILHAPPAAKKTKTDTEDS